MRNRVNIMGVPIDKVDINEALQRCIGFLRQEECKMICTPNAEIVMLAQTDLELMKILTEADLIVPDGIGLIYASKIQKTGLAERVTGVDLMKKILDYCDEEKKSIYILGGKPGVAELASQNIKKTYPNLEVKGYRDGYFKIDQEKSIVEKINEIQPDVLFVALGAPRQEKWIYQYKNILKAKAAIGVGGGVDIWAGTAKRAPLVYQQLGLEWFYRLLKEPWRYKRMMVLPKFMIKVLLSRR